MQKKNRAGILVIIMIVMSLLSGCLGKREPGSDQDSHKNNPSDQPVIAGTILRITENSILVLEKKEENDFCGLLDVSINDVPVTDIQNKALSTSDLVTGLLVNVYYDGQILETYPGRITGTSQIEVVEQTGDLMGMYLRIIKELYEEDPGLNSGINTIVLDLTNINNLTEDQKEILRYLVDCEYEQEVRFGTIEQLQVEGVIKDLYYEDGIVFILSDQALKDNKFEFKVQKWRSGLGSIGYNNCKATIKDDIWEYKLSGAWIS
ncbi:MAG: DUF3221 domain-containing protein [Clostridiales bacterium]|nr:DUF3221 domain-containing protein [Clostridiales bacterium]